MMKNYLKIALRFLLKNKTYSFINIIGLSVGTLCCLYIVMYVTDQYNYDNQEGAENIYRVTSTLIASGEKHKMATCSPVVGPALKLDFPEVAQFTRVVPTISAGKQLLRYGEQSIYETDAFFADSTFFDVFTYHFVSGNPRNALQEPYSIVLMKPVAEKLFGNANPVGKFIEIDNSYGKHNFKVTAVVDESLGKSHIQARMFFTMNSGGIGEYVRQSNTWAGQNFTNTYIKLLPRTSAAMFERKLPAFLDKYGHEDLKLRGMEKQLHLQPVRSIHTTTGYEAEKSKTVSSSFLNVLLLIAFLIQLIACINFMNLSTARASKRATEIGVRKATGAKRKDLIKQFLSESFLLTIFGVAIALPLLILLLPYFNQITHTNIQLTSFTFNNLWYILPAIIVITGLIAGSYPAFYLSAFQTIKVIKGNFTNRVSAGGVRRSLVLFQFITTVVLIAGILGIYSQLHYIQNKDLGFDENQKLIFSFYTSDSKAKMTSLANDLQKVAEINGVSKSTNFLSQFIPRDYSVYLAGGNMTTSVNAQNIVTDEYFVKVNGIKLLSGRDLRPDDSGKVLINETLARRLGLKPETAPGTFLYSKNGSDPEFHVEIAGVMKDFNYNSLHDDIRPFMLVYRTNESDLSHLIVSVSSNNYQSLIKKVETIWQKDLSGVPFEYSFLDDEVNKQYETEIILSRIINSFTLIAIFISCLGLFGLTAFSAEQRRKEIGIRKIIGASVLKLAAILSQDFLKLVIIAIIVATPVAWWAIHRWLESFAYKTNLSWWIFALSGLMALGIALLTVSWQSWRTAARNPVEALRYE
ncbi:MAG TPA: ABC transporter permease [Draconibacterium sp.]|nr:ABC transporter permease [Draconibacterium sp.]